MSIVDAGAGKTPFDVSALDLLPVDSEEYIPKSIDQGHVYALAIEDVTHLPFALIHEVLSGT